MNTVGLQYNKERIFVHRIPTIVFHPTFSDFHVSCNFNSKKNLSGMGPPVGGAPVVAVHVAVSVTVDTWQ